ncbi:hypothetical protein HYU93_04990 [Candidatus Daviesbacteria bacterium]|nr:hypothetical protein [Candidatus Daviesbacteria bacterium]
MDNHSYNLIKALIKKANAVLVYEQNLKDSPDCGECRPMWKKLKEEDKKHLEELKKLLYSHTAREAIK